MFDIPNKMTANNGQWSKTVEIILQLEFGSC